MRKVYGEDITIKELKNTWFGYEDEAEFSEMVETIEVGDFRYTINEEEDFYIRYPIDNFEDNFADCYHRDKAESVYSFIINFGLDEFNNIEDFIFYFSE